MAMALETPVMPTTREGAATAGRFVALDALRGLTVALMLLVNNVALGAFTPDQLEHAPWGGGVHLADLVFPWFLFCAGAALPFAWSAARKRDPGRWSWIRKAIVRAVWLLALGCLLTSVVAHAPVFSLGVLQLIGLAGLLAALLEPQPQSIRAGVAMLLLIGYWVFLRFVSVPGLEPGTFEAGRNPAARLNVWLDDFGLRGLPSVIPTTALMLLASVIGSRLRQAQGWPDIARLGLMGLGLTGLGFLWNLDLEFNKPHWTPAYILFSAGTATLILTVFRTLETRWRGWFWPLEVFGSNALLGYVAPILVKIWVLQDWKVNGQNLQNAALTQLTTLFGRVTGGWAYTLAYILAWWLVLFWLYRKKLFWRV